MNLFTFWKNKKNKNKHTVIVPSTVLLTGMSLIENWSKLAEPKLLDYPKNKYNGYWEIVLDIVENKYVAVVKFYSYTSGFIDEIVLSDFSLPTLKTQVNSVITDTMEKFKV